MKTLITWLIFAASSVMAALPPGIYSGSYSGFQRGDFIVILDANSQATAVGYDATYKELVWESVTVAADGGFGFWVDSGWATGRLTETSLTASAPGLTFTARRERPTGPFSALAGVYYGSYSGTDAGDAAVILLPSGIMWFVAAGVDTYDAGRGSLGSGGSFSITSFYGTRLSGRVQGGTGTGTWRGATAGSGSFNVTRYVTLSQFLDLVPLARTIVSGAWAQHPKLGWYTEVSYPWVWVESQGWWYFSRLDNDSAWVHDRQLGWCFVREQNLPWMYASARREWVYYQGTAAGQRRFYGTTSGWFTMPLSR